MSRYLPGYRERVGEPFVLRCRECRLMNHAACSGRPDGPPGAVCRCATCWRKWSMDTARAYMDSNNAAMVRITMKALYGILAQNDAARQARLKRGPKPTRCIGCGTAMTTWRLDGRGSWCSPKCKMRAARRRWRARDAAETGPAQRYEAEPAGPATVSTAPPAAIVVPAVPQPPNPAEVWLAVHGR